MWRAAGLLLVLAAFVAPNRATPYPKTCNNGPGYWCANLRNAQECGAAGHCLQTVWSKQRYPFDSSPIAIKFTKLFDQLHRSHTSYDDEGLQVALDEACRSVPHAAAGLRCKQHVAGRAADVRGLLAAELPPAALCTVLSLCNDEKMHRLLQTAKHAKLEKATPKLETFKLLGSERCTWGPSYWCANFSNSHDCRATQHCIQRVWSKTKVAEDNDDICKICTDMVTQARDQLESNETQEELKEVFEGSCKLIPIKLVTKECMRLADDFVPELVETLASEMNPRQVCSVAGLCNSARIDKLLAQYEKTKASELQAREECAGCRQVVGVIRKKFDETKYDQFLVGLLKSCRGLGSFSDSCSMLTFAHYEELVAALREHLTADAVCHLSGQCSVMYHSHAEDYAVEVSSGSDSGVVRSTGNDLPCELCEQLVKHLRDVVIANTTESEFFTVLKGICKQTGNFRDECLSLVEQWYPVIYNYLVSDLKPAEVCALGGICPKLSASEDVPVAPLVVSELTVKTITPSSKLIGQDEYHSYTVDRVGVPSQQTSVRVLGADPASYALPLERMMLRLPQGKAECAMCQYILHYLQVEISDSRNSDEIREAVDHACEHLPSQVSEQCKQFVQAYGPAVIALIVQEIDPASVCPALHICPKEVEVRRVTINADHSSCPLCLFAVEQLESVLENNKTEENIKHALENLCSHLSAKLKPQCTDFVDAYAAQLVEMLEADLNAKEICVYLRLCADTLARAPLVGTDTPAHVTESPIDMYHRHPELRGDGNRVRKAPVSAGVIDTNEISDTTYNGHVITPTQKSSCVICEFVLKEIDSEIKDRSNEDEIKKIVHSICNKMPKSVSGECNQFVDKYADLVVALLAQELDADAVCRELKLCDPTVRHIRTQLRENILDCAVCETVVAAVDKVLSNPAVDHRVVHVVEKACALLPAKYYDRCHTLLEVYGDSIIHLIEQYGTRGVCQKIGLCGGQGGVYVQMYRAHRH